MQKIVNASCKNLKVSPRKLSLVAGMINKMPVGNAITQLTFCSKRIAYDVKKCLISAISNARHNFGLSADDLFVSSITVGKGLFLKRAMPRARGRSAKVVKKYSNLYISLSEVKV